MMLSELLKDRDLWQNNTVNRMKDALLYKPTNLGAMSSGEKLVVVYGPPQIGKTTLILNLLGIADDYQNEVYDVLRAGVKKGNSSTSTAIIYQKSLSDLYGVRYENSATHISNEVQYFSADEMLQFLKSVRDNVEHGNASKEILYIFLPARYFTQESTFDENIDILDLPGDGSRNENEANHVQDILRKYLAMASVSIIACKANEIQSLETLEIQGDPNWRMQPNKYIGVITNAYGQGSIKKYFLLNQVERKSGFAEFVAEQYHSALQTILPAFCQVKFYPVDMGESLKRLQDSLLPDDQYIVEHTLDDMFLQIRTDIMSHQGNTLRSMIDLLRTYSSEYVKTQITELENEIEDLNNQIAVVNQQISDKTVRIAECEEMISELTAEYERIVGIEKHQLNYSGVFYLKSVIDYITENFGKKISDPNHLIFKIFKDNVFFYLSNLKSQVKYTELCIPDEASVYSDLAQEIPFEAELESLLYPKGIVHKFDKADREKCITIITTNFNLIVASVSRLYEDQKVHVIQQHKSTKAKYLNYNQLKVESGRDIENCSRRRTELESALKTKSERLSVLLDNREKDRKVLSEYLKVAEDEYNNQIERCNVLLSTCSREEKVAVIIFMALLERDFNSLIRER